MSTKVPIVKVKILEKLLFYLGFEAKRQSGVHKFASFCDYRIDKNQKANSKKRFAPS